MMIRSTPGTAQKSLSPDSETDPSQARKVQRCTDQANAGRHWLGLGAKGTTFRIAYFFVISLQVVSITCAGLLKI